jgi:tetratricopeptide (TPR) repeat protein
MGDAFFRRGENSLAREHYGQALAYLGFRMPETRGEVRRALARELLVQLVHRSRGRYSISSEPVSPSVVDEVLICRDAGYIDGFINAERAMMFFLRMLNVSEQRGYGLGVVLGCYGLGMSFDLIGWFDRAGWYHRHALAVAEKLGTPYALAAAYSGLQNTARCSGQLTSAFEYGQRAGQIYQEVGNSFEKAFVTSISGWLAVHWGKLAEAQARSQELVRLGQDAGARNAWCWGETALGYTLNRQGDLAAAIIHLQKAIELAEAIPDHIYRIFASSELGSCYLRQGDYNRACSELENCLRLRAKQRMFEVSGYIVTLNNLAEAQLYAAGQCTGSERAGWLRQARSTLRTAWRESPKFPVKTAQILRLQGTYDWLCGKSAAAQNWWQKSLAEAERMGLRYDLGINHLEMGQQLGARHRIEHPKADIEH